MRNRLSLLVVALAALGVASCGGGDDSTTATDAKTAPAQERSADTAPPAKSNGDGSARSGRSNGQADAGDESSGDFTPKPHEDSGGGAKQFQVKGGDNSVQEFGAEVEGSEFDRASAALHDFLDARAEREWAAACEYLGSGIAKSLEELASQATKGEDASCATGLEQMTNPAAAKELRQEAAQVDVGSVRVEDDRGFVLYRVDKTVYAIPIEIEGGDFKVTGLAGLPLN
ncbi:MAG TPA: hypothetical protein VFY04_07025 [Solirubrobacterales bacterium]|nr:hypothetical protein [Solirubrobacterales bacterium]